MAVSGNLVVCGGVGVSFLSIHVRIARRLPAMIAAAVTVALAVIIVVLPIAVTLLVAFAQGVSFATSTASYFQTGANGSQETR